jgi:hypothetical protein
VLITVQRKAAVLTCGMEKAIFFDKEHVKHRKTVLKFCVNKNTLLET